MLPAEQTSARQHGPLNGVDFPVGNSQKTNPRLPLPAESLTKIVSGDSRRNGEGAIAPDKNDRNIP